MWHGSGRGEVHVGFGGETQGKGEDNIQMDLKEKIWKVLDCIVWAQDRDKY